MFRPNFRPDFFGDFSAIFFRRFFSGGPERAKRARGLEPGGRGDGSCGLRVTYIVARLKLLIIRVVVP